MPAPNRLLLTFVFLLCLSGSLIAEEVSLEQNGLTTGLETHVMWSIPPLPGELVDVEIYYEVHTYLSGVFNNENWTKYYWPSSPQYVDGVSLPNTIQWNVIAEGISITWYCYVSVGITSVDDNGTPADPTDDEYHYRWAQTLVGLADGFDDTLWVLFGPEDFHS